MNTADIYKVCKSNKVFGGVYAKDTYRQVPKQAKLYVVNTDPSWSPGEHWFVVDHTQEPCVVFDSYGAKSPTSSSKFWQGTLGTAYYFNDILQGATTNVCGDYCVFYVFCVHQLHPLNVVLPCCASLGVAPMSETIVCAR